MTVSAAVSAVLAACAHASALAAPLQQADQASAPTESQLQASIGRTRDFAEGTASIDPSKPIAFEIPPQSLASALVAFSTQAGIQFTAPARSLARIQCPGVQGSFTPEAALRMLLRDTGFSYRVVGASTVAISAVDDASAPAGAANASAAAAKEGKATLPAAFGWLRRLRQRLSSP